MSRILFLDASFDRPFIAYDDVLLELNSSGEMAEAVKGLGVFDVVAAGAGPGSYTGMRVAFSLASALSLALEVPLVTLSALYGFAPKEEGAFEVMLDARSGGVYLLSGTKRANVVFEGSPTKKPLEEVRLRDFVLSPCIAPLQARLPGKTCWIEAMPDPGRLFPLIEEKMKKGDYSLSGQAELLYLGRTL